MKKLLKHMRKYIFFALLCPVLMVLEVLADIYIPYLMSRIVDIGIVNQDIEYIVQLGLIMVVAALLAMVFGILSSHFGARAGYVLPRELEMKSLKRSRVFFC